MVFYNDASMHHKKSKNYFYGLYHLSYVYNDDKYI